MRRSEAGQSVLVVVVAVALRCGWVVLVGWGVVMTARASSGMWNLAGALTIGDIREARLGLLPACWALAVTTVGAGLLGRSWWGPACLYAACWVTVMNWFVSADVRNAGYALYSLPAVAILALAGVVVTLVRPRRWRS